ncbi:MAG: dihydrofolate reductase [Bacteroidales bacterium]|nr:dihydrofolate reductase [Bacteroidales bacterium]
MKTFKLITGMTLMAIFTGCAPREGKEKQENATGQPGDFKFLLEQFADLKIMRYQVPGFDELTPRQRVLIYYLSEAALCGRDIVFDQNFRYNLIVRKTLEEIFTHYEGDRNHPDFGKFTVYLKRVWFSNGIHHHYSTDKIDPGFSGAYFEELVRNSPGAVLPLREGQTVREFVAWLSPILFDPNVAPKRISLDPSTDMVQSSACNFYDGLTQQEAELFYEKMKDPSDPDPVSYGLNSRLVKKDGQIVEEVYRVGGLYGPAVEKVVYWLEQASGVAENEHQHAVISKLIDYYRTGNLETFDEYNVLWVNDLDSRIDFVNGFIEVYGDPLGMKATWESVVNFKDMDATRRTEIISSNAQWFEDHSPVDARFRKKKVKGVSAKVITVAQLGGDCYPSTPIGINLPNADWIRKEHGSKSVTMENITYAYDQAALGNGFLEEFCASEEEIGLAKEWGSLGSNVHTDLHECLGHGSGQLLPGTSPEALKNYSSALEEARADLFALYYIMDPKMVELGVLPSLHPARAEYNTYIRNGLMSQLTRIEPGKNIEQAHMRNRQLVASWCCEKGRDRNIIEKFSRDGKTFVRINDYEGLRGLFGELLAEVQRIKSEGDYKAGMKLVEGYGVQVDTVLHQEVLERFRKLNIAPYGGFVNPLITPVMQNGQVTDAEISYPDDYTKQMLYYSEKYSFLDQ